MTLPPPHPCLRVCVVVPARNEEELISGCLQSLARQEKVRYEEYEILLVLDSCTDATESRANRVLKSNPFLRMHLLQGPGIGAGHARRVGMEAACARLLETGREAGLIASTDADTVVAPDWLKTQLEAAARGARAIGGRIALPDDGSVPQDLLDWHLERGRRRHVKLLSEPGSRGRTEHWQFSGASLAVNAATYREVGGLQPLAALEDEGLEQILVRHRVPIDRLLSVRVTTSARLLGRANRGLAHDLAQAALRGYELPEG